MKAARVRPTGAGTRCAPGTALCVLLLAAAGVEAQPVSPEGGGAEPAPAASLPTSTVGIVALHRVDVAASGTESIAVPVVSFGAGAVVSPDGTVATAREVVEGAVFVGLHVPGRADLVPAVRVDRAQDDLALLVPATAGSSAFDLSGAAGEAPAAAGRRVFVGGFPVGADDPSRTDASVLRGMVYGLIELSAPLDASSFGGPVVDADGRLLGIVALRHQDDPGIAYALPVSTIADALDRATADGSLATATARATGSGGAPFLPAAAVDPRWVQAGDAVFSADAWCASGLAAALPGAPPDADGPGNGQAALLYGALAWNAALCDLRRIGLGVEFLSRRETVGAWLSQGNPTLDRIAGAAALVRRARDAEPHAFVGSPFAEALLAFETDLRTRLAEVRAGLPAVPPPVPVEPLPVGPTPIGPAPIEPIETPVPLEEETYAEPDPTRTIWSPTAFLPEEGTVNLRTVDFGLWSLEYTLNRNVMIHGSMMVPIMNFSLLPGARFAAELHEYVRVALDTHVGFWLLYPTTEVVLLLYGGAPALTIGTRDFFLNVSLLVYGATVFTRDSTWDATGAESQTWGDETFLFLSPNIGGSLRISRRVKVNLELHAPALLDAEGDTAWDFGKVWAFAYGVRIFGQRFYGDVSFVVPIFPGVMEILQFLPIGLPMINFGVQW